MIRLFKFLKPFAIAVAAIIILVFLQALADLYLPTLLKDIVDTGVVKGDTDYIWRIGGFMLLVAGASGVASIIATYLSAQTATGFGRDLRSRVFSQVTGFSLNEFDKLGTATLITRTTNDITQVQQVLILIMRMMIYAPLVTIGGIILAVSLDATLSLVLVVVIPILAASIWLIASKGVPLFRLLQKRLDKVNLVLRENLTGIRVIRAFNRTDYEMKRFGVANSELAETAIKVNRILGLLLPVMLLIMNFTSIAIIWFGGLRIDAGEMQVGSLIAFLQYATQILFSLLMLSMLFVMVPRAQASAVRINEVLNMVSEINDPDLKTLERWNVGTLERSSDQRSNVPTFQRSNATRGTVEFRDVTFSYPGAEQPAISNISFSANPGEVVAIIGGTGSGKSTLVNLIPRFYDVDQGSRSEAAGSEDGAKRSPRVPGESQGGSGSILIDGVDVREMTQESLRAKIGFVPQQAVLFTGTIADNIRFGKEDASEQEVEHAARTAQAMEFISTMKDGFDSVISQGGANVSGGQKQRLSIARALVRKPEIYLFDDTFSALDFKTDAKLRMALRRETAGATMIIVAQRVSTVLDADKIIVLEEGKIAGMGKHKELMKTSEVYREIVASQLSEEELAA